MKKKKFRSVVVWKDTDEIVENTTDPVEMLLRLKPLLNGLGDISFHMIEVDDNGKIVKSLDNMDINEEIIKKLRKASA